MTSNTNNDEYVIVNFYRQIPDRQTLEREYSPSSCVTDIREFIDAYVSRSEAVRKELPERIILAYGESPAEVIDFFPATAARTDGARPVLVYIHGGYWQELSKDEHSFPAAALNRHDISYVAVGYGLAPAASMKEMVDRCRRAIAWIVAHSAQLAIDPAQIHVSGSSAGAHLAAMAGLADWQRFGLPRNPIRSLTLLSGVYDLRPLLLTYINDAVGMNEDDALLNSPQLRIDSAQGEFPPRWWSTATTRQRSSSVSQPNSQTRSHARGTGRCFAKSVDAIISTCLSISRKRRRCWVS